MVPSGPRSAPGGKVWHPVKRPIAANAPLNKVSLFIVIIDFSLRSSCHLFTADANPSLLLKSRKKAHLQMELATSLHRLDASKGGFSETFQCFSASLERYAKGVAGDSMGLFSGRPFVESRGFWRLPSRDRGIGES